MEQPGVDLGLAPDYASHPPGNDKVSDIGGLGYHPSTIKEETERIAPGQAGPSGAKWNESAGTHAGVECFESTRVNVIYTTGWLRLVLRLSWCLRQQNVYL